MWWRANPCYLPGHKGADMAKFKPRFGRGSGKRHPVDVHVGGRVKQRRVLLGMTQTGLGDAIGLTFQQVQKYERGANRIGASRLLALTQALDVSIDYFFEDMPTAVAAISPATKRRGKAKKLPRYEFDPMVKRETLKLVRAYYKIEDANVRQRVRELTKVLGAAGVKLWAKRRGQCRSVPGCLTVIVRERRI
jgi:transcriptional regulator with XRE-family HTH domain